MLESGGTAVLGFFRGVRLFCRDVFWGRLYFGFFGFGFFFIIFVRVVRGLRRGGIFLFNKYLLGIDCVLGFVFGVWNMLMN